MAQRDPTRPQITRQDIGEELTRLLEIMGPLGELDVSDEVRIVVILQALGFLKARSFTPSVTLAEIFGGGATAPAAGSVFSDTGPLQIGTYDVGMIIAFDTQTGTRTIQLEWRNAANTATLQTFDIIEAGGTTIRDFAFEVETADERFRVTNFDALDATTVIVTSLTAVLRPRSVFPEIF